MKARQVQNRPEQKDDVLPISPVRRQGHTDHMVSSIMSMIEQGILKEGDALPPERELAQRFEVGRNTLREAIKVLEIFGVVRRAPRLGTVIQHANLDAILGIAFAGIQITPTVFEDIQGFRKLIELGIARTVVERASDEDFKSLRVLITRMEATGDLREQARWDYEFHLAIVEISGNAILSRSYRVLAEPIKRLMEIGKGTHGTCAAVEQHINILAALEARALKVYVERLAAHMDFGRRFLSGTT